MYPTSAIAHSENSTADTAALAAAAQLLLMMTGGWRPPHQARTPLKALIAGCERSSCEERQLMKEARKSAASLVAMRPVSDEPALIADIAYNAGGFWLWHRDLELWVSGDCESCWLIPRDPCAGGRYWTVMRGALIAEDAPPFRCGEARMHGVQAGRRLVRRLVGGL